jgi:hypothetical protein
MKKALVAKGFFLRVAEGSRTPDPLDHNQVL